MESSSSTSLDESSGCIRFAQRNKIGLNCVLVLNETYDSSAKGSSALHYYRETFVNIFWIRKHQLVIYLSSTFEYMFQKSSNSECSFSKVRDRHRTDCDLIIGTYTLVITVWCSLNSVLSCSYRYIITTVTQTCKGGLDNIDDNIYIFVIIRTQKLSEVKCVTRQNRKLGWIEIETRLFWHAAKARRARLDHAYVVH